MARKINKDDWDMIVVGISIIAIIVAMALSR